jgi:pimeloyl-ACP methyl ester carboxylesterase
MAIISGSDWRGAAAGATLGPVSAPPRPSHPPVIFLPGASGDGGFWRPLAALLPADWPKTFLDWPGLGAVAPSPAVNGFEDLVGLVLERLDGAVDLVAQSMGGVVALRAALARPARVRRLVLVATSGGVDTRRFGAADWRPQYARDFPHARSWIVEAHPDLTADLPSVQAPALLIWGDADPISPVVIGSYLAGVLPRARLVIVPGGVMPSAAIGRPRSRPRWRATSPDGYFRRPWRSRHSAWGL